MALSLKQPESTRALAFVLGTGLRTGRGGSALGKDEQVAPTAAARGALARGAAAGAGAQRDGPAGGGHGVGRAGHVGLFLRAPRGTPERDGTAAATGREAAEC